MLICTSWPGMPSRRSNSRMTRPTALTSTSTAPARPRKMRSWNRSTPARPTRIPGSCSSGSSPTSDSAGAATYPTTCARCSVSGYMRVVPISTEIPGRSGAFTSIRAISSQLRKSRSTTGTKRRLRRISRSIRAFSCSPSGTIFEKVSSVAPTSAVCSATSSARQLSRLPATTFPLRSSTRPRGGANSRALTRFSSASVA